LSDPADSGAIRLQKYLSQAGAASRREAERLMEAGRVSVNGEVVRELGVRVVPGVDRITLDGRPVGMARTRWLAYHKPPGVLTTRADPHGGRTIYDELPDDAGGLHYVGRLDRDAEGLLLLTNDGDLANRLQHPSGGVEREYRLEVAGVVTAETRRALLAGVPLEDGLARPAAVRTEGTDGVRSRMTVVLTEGRKREVRRMMSAVGHPVLRLSRTRFGTVELGELPRGHWRELDGEEIRRLARLVGSRGA
jgi:23S rRNA pseudouridine2605 synthase